MRRSVIHILFLAMAGWVGCSSDRGKFDNESHDFADRDAGLPDAGCSGVVCSRDLRSVRDCATGALVKECPADKACGNGECIAPCDAAAVNEGSVGCSFAMPPSNSGTVSIGSCTALFVANNWTSPATVKVEYQGEEKSLDGALGELIVEGGVVKHRKLEGPIPPGGGAIVFVSHDRTYSANRDWTGCPTGIKPIFEKDHAILGTGIGHAVIARTDVPVSVYSVSPYGAAADWLPSGTLVLPTTSMRKNYVVASSWGGSNDRFGYGELAKAPLVNTGELGRPTLQIVATEDDTSIDLLPRVAVIGGRGVHSSAANEVANYKLKRGEVLQFVQNNELVGSVLESTKPVAVFGGNTCMNVPSGITACDSDNKQIPPLSAWGHEYAVVTAPNRSAVLKGGRPTQRDPRVIRLVAAANDTQLVYEPAMPAGAPASLEAGQLARFFADESFVVRSQDAAHPFYVAALMAGAQVADSLGDPETAISVPTDQWLDSYVFFTDPSYKFSLVTVARRKSNGAFQDVTLDCAGTISDWQSINDDYEWASVSLTRFGRPQTYPAGTCTDGTHRIHSQGPFSVSVWGLSSYASYSYPGGMGLRPVTQLHVPVR